MTELALTAADVQHAPRGRTDQLEQLSVRRQSAALEGVRRRNFVLRMVTQAELVQLEIDHGLHDVFRVFHAIYVADLIPVVSRDRAFDDAQAGGVKLNDD